MPNADNIAAPGRRSAPTDAKVIFTYVPKVAGYPHDWKPTGSRSLLAAAKRNLRDRYAAFGLQNEFQESLNRIADAFGWHIGVEDTRRAKQTRIEKTLDEEDRAAVERWNRLDMDLFDYAQDLFRQKALV